MSNKCRLKWFEWLAVCRPCFGAAGLYTCSAPWPDVTGGRLDRKCFNRWGLGRHQHNRCQRSDSFRFSGTGYVDRGLPVNN